MYKKIAAIGLCFALLMANLPTAGFAETTPKGHLVIVGGGLASTNTDVYEKFINLSGGVEKSKIGIIPAASSSLSSSKNFKADLQAYGLSESQISILPLAISDDSKTKDVDESLWKANADQSALADSLQGFTGIWFVGGDQTRVTKLLLHPDGSDTLVLKGLRTLYSNGGTLGGTSAGAAIMSPVMIAGGTSLGALTQGISKTYTDENDQLSGPLYMTKGLGFFPYGLVDQHFDTRARLGRLTVAAWQYKSQYPNAFGIDEDTALIFDNATKTIEIAGKGGITIVNHAKSVKDEKQKQFTVSNVNVSFLSPGDTFNVLNQKVSISESKDSTKGYEYYEVKGPIAATGVFSGYNEVKPFIMYNLIDNAAVSSIKSYCFDASGKGSEITFSKDSQTEGWWGYQDGNKDSYSAVNVHMSIKPVSVKVSPLSK